MSNRESGLLGMSEISSDLSDLLERSATGVRAAEAVALFGTRKWVGASPLLGGHRRTEHLDSALAPVRVQL